MTDPRQHAASGDAGCLDFEILSCCADGELDDAAAAAVAAHLGTCARCAGLSARLQIAFATPAVRRDGGVRTDCIDEEALVAYALGRDGADGSIAAHLAACDGCVTVLSALHQRLAIADRIDAPVPADVQRRARLALEAEPEQAPPVPRPQPARVAFLDRWRRALRVPVLVPAALAAGMVAMVALRAPVDRGSAVPGERARAVAPEAVSMRITAREAQVHSRPSGQSDVVATVRRGTTVTVAGAERDWYEVHLDGGRLGWVEREAFE